MKSMVQEIDNYLAGEEIYAFMKSEGSLLYS
jgi:hypothetical protein